MMILSVNFIIKRNRSTIKTANQISIFVLQNFGMMAVISNLSTDDWRTTRWSDPSGYLPCHFDLPHRGKEELHHHNEVASHWHGPTARSPQNFSMSSSLGRNQVAPPPLSQQVQTNTTITTRWTLSKHIVTDFVKLQWFCQNLTDIMRAMQIITKTISKHTK